MIDFEQNTSDDSAGSNPDVESDASPTIAGEQQSWLKLIGRLQNDRRLIRDKFEDTWQVNSEAELTGSAPIVLAQTNLIIDRPIITNGQSIVLAGETIKFTGRGRVHTGFRSTANRHGREAGDITIVAKRVVSLNISTEGQDGGRGAKGRTGYTGDYGSSGSDGADARCPHTNGKNGQPGGRGGRGGTGGRGQTGGNGGDAGNVSIRYLVSDVALRAGASIQINGGSGGEGGVGGNGGDGGPGGSGGAGGSGDYCHRGGSRNHDVWVDGGSPGRDGPKGPDGYDGPKGYDGKNGDIGNLSTDEFDSEIACYEALSEFLPESAGGLLKKAEIYLLLNQNAKAKELAKTVFDSTSNRDDRIKAKIVELKADGNINFFGNDRNLVALRFKDSPDGSRSVPYTLEDIEQRFASTLERVSASEAILRYRESRKWDAERVEEAYALEASKISQKIADYKNSIARFGREIETLNAKLESFRVQADVLARRIERLVGDLAALPKNVVENVRALIASVGEFGAGVAAVTTALSGGQWAAVFSALQGLLRSIDRGVSAVHELIKIGQKLKLRLDQTKDQLFMIKTEIESITAQIRGLRTRTLESKHHISDLQIMRQQLDDSWNSRDTAKLAALFHLSKRVHWEVRVSAAEEIYSLLAHIDLVLKEKNLNQVQEPPGGIFHAFDETHLLKFQGLFAEKLRGAPVTTRVPFRMASLSRSEFPEEFDLFDALQPVNLVVTDLPEIFSESSIVKFDIKFVGRNIESDYITFEMRNHNVVHFNDRSNAGQSFTVPNYRWVGNKAGGNDGSRVFSHQSPISIWSFAVRSHPAVSATSIDESSDGDVDRLTGQISRPPKIEGDRILAVPKGSSARVARTDLSGYDPDTPESHLMFTVSGESKGFIAHETKPDSPISEFSATDLSQGMISFVHDGSEGGWGGFDVMVNDNTGAASDWKRVTVFIYSRPKGDKESKGGSGSDDRENSVEMQSRIERIDVIATLAVPAEVLKSTSEPTVQISTTESDISTESRTPTPTEMGKVTEAFSTIEGELWERLSEIEVELEGQVPS